jgi:hypothetical protein
MTRRLDGSAPPQVLNSLDELSRTLDYAATDPRLPPAPTVKVVHLPDVLPRRPATKTATAAPWWVDVEPVAAKPQMAQEESVVVVGELVSPPPRRSRLIDWRLVGSSAVAAVLVLGGMVYAGWAVASRPVDVVAVKPLVPPVVEAVPAPPPKPQATPQAAAEQKLAEIEKKYEAILAKLEANAEQPPEPKPTPKEEPLVEQPPAKPAGNCYGTAVNFASTPLEAAEEAVKNKKLMIVLTISGNFEESKFT